MNAERLAGTVVKLICCWGCGGLFFGLGLWALGRKKPMHFWAGSTIDPERVSDIPAYNRENGRLWILYSIPYWLSGVLYLVGMEDSWGSIGCLALLVFAGTAGLYWLVKRYKRIERKFITSHR